MCEVVIGPHRADVLSSDNVIVELQNSSISAEDIEKENRFINRSQAK